MTRYGSDLASETQRRMRDQRHGTHRRLVRDKGAELVAAKGMRDAVGDFLLGSKPGRPLVETWESLTTAIEQDLRASGSINKDRLIFPDEAAGSFALTALTTRRIGEYARQLPRTDIPDRIEALCNHNTFERFAAQAPGLNSAPIGKAGIQWD